MTLKRETKKMVSSARVYEKADTISTPKEEDLLHRSTKKIEELLKAMLKDLPYLLWISYWNRSEKEKSQWSWKKT